VRATLLLAGVTTALIVSLVLAVVLRDPDRAEEPGGPPQAHAAQGFWVSSPTDPARRLAQPDPVRAPATAAVNVDTDATGHRVWRGTGAALTDASVQLLSQHPDALAELFDPGAGSGAGLNLLRLPLTSTDMSPEAWTWGWDGTTASPSGQAEAAASLVTDRILPLREDLQVVAAPWTAPAWMKDSRSVRGGALETAQQEQYGKLLVAQADWLRQHGVPLAALTLGNEPGYSADYPSMTMTDEQLAALGATVGPALHDRAVELWAVDHNWADRPRYDAVLGAAPGAFDAAAFHCYAGNPDQMAGLSVPAVVTECTGTDGSWEHAFAWDARHLVTDAVAAGSTGLLMWNLATDASSGPRDPASTQGCSNCRGLVSVTDAGVEKQPEFYTLAHLSRAASPGAHVVDSSATRGLVVAVFANPDGSIGVFGHNDTGTDQTVVLRVDGQPGVRHTVRAGELFTLREDHLSGGHTGS